MFLILGLLIVILLSVACLLASSLEAPSNLISQVELDALIAIAQLIRPSPDRPWITLELAPNENSIC